jgi:hypothetical protein
MGTMSTQDELSARLTSNFRIQILAIIFNTFVFSIALFFISLRLDHFINVSWSAIFVVVVIFDVAVFLIFFKLLYDVFTGKQRRRRRRHFTHIVIAFVLYFTIVIQQYLFFTKINPGTYHVPVTSNGTVTNNTTIEEQEVEVLTIDLPWMVVCFPSYLIVYICIGYAAYMCPVRLLNPPTVTLDIFAPESSEPSWKETVALRIDVLVYYSHFFAVALFATLCIVFFSLQLDHVIHWPWALFFVPLAVLDLCAIVFILRYMYYLLDVPQSNSRQRYLVICTLALFFVVLFIFQQYLVVSNVPVATQHWTTALTPMYMMFVLGAIILIAILRESLYARLDSLAYDDDSDDEDDEGEDGDEGGL